jgi:hypothetical protein
MTGSAEQPHKTNQKKKRATHTEQSLHATSTMVQQPAQDFHASTS